MGKRSHGEGTVYRKTDGSWRAQVTIDGQRLSFSAPTRKACAKWLQSILGQIEQGLTYDATRTTYGDYLDGWLSQKQTVLRIHTIEQYQRTIHKYILPYLKTIKLNELTPGRIQGLYDQLRQRGVTPRAVQVVHAVIYGSLQQALKLGIIGRNPADAVVKPAVIKREMQVWNESQISQFLVAIQGHRNETLYRLALATGMRRGELVGLQWIDVDWLGQSIYVQRQVTQPDGGGFEFTSTKTNAGRRKISLGDGLIQAFRAQYDRVQTLRAAVGKNWKENDLVFPSMVGTPIDGYNLSKEFQDLAAIAGVQKIRFHDLRHTAASMMLNHGIPVIVVSRILGHSKPSITMDIYGHIIPGMQDQAASLMDQITTVVSVEVGSDRFRIA